MKWFSVEGRSHLYTPITHGWNAEGLKSTAGLKSTPSVWMRSVSCYFIYVPGMEESAEALWYLNSLTDVSETICLSKHKVSKSASTFYTTFYSWLLVSTPHRSLSEEKHAPYILCWWYAGANFVSAKAAKCSILHHEQIVWDALILKNHHQNCTSWKKTRSKVLKYICN